MQELCGWHNNPAEVERIWSAMPTPFFQAPAPEQGRDQHNHLIFKDFTGVWHPEGPQKIGDCVSWGNARLVNYLEVLEAWVQIQEKKAADPNYREDADDGRYIYEEICTEAIYGLSRVEIGHQRGSYQDGSVGAWAAKALMQYGIFSRADLDRMGKSGAYDPNRAKEWGARGLPSDLEGVAKRHPVADMTPVRSFNEAAFHIQNLRTVAVCSNVGFENGRGGMTQRDSTGRATPRGRWDHCMTFVSLRWKPNPQLLLCNQWPPGAVQGPMGDVEIPPCSWWVDAEVCDEMLGQNDSFTGTKYKGYPIRRATWKF
jgi:hypothetical protein